MNVAILGASEKPERFAYKALKKLRENGHNVFLVSPKLKEIEGTAVVAKLSDINEPIHTVTMYVGAQISSGLLDDFIGLDPRRVIFNPGSENSELQDALEALRIRVVEDCTLVLLDSGEFEDA
jgi:uncharacterized protein